MRGHGYYGATNFGPGFYGYGYGPYSYGYDRWLRGGTFAGLGAADSPDVATAIDVATTTAASAAADAIADAVAQSADSSSADSGATQAVTSETSQLPLEKHSLFDWGEMPSPIGTQILSIAAGVSGATAAFILSLKLRNATRISMRDVALATSIGVIGAFVGIFFIRHYR